ncbi:MAG: GNAT family N-acetyltransferase, partial [Patescibacteria group bacterium]
MDISIERLKVYSSGLTEAINNLLKQLDDTATLLTKTDVEDIITSPASRVFVARRLGNKKIIGMLTLIVFRIPFVRKGLLEDIVVDEEYRGKGIGTKLI